MPKYFKKPSSKFLKVECDKCNETQVIFNSPASKVECSNCGEKIAESTGGRGEILGEVKKTLE